MGKNWQIAFGILFEIKVRFKQILKQEVNQIYSANINGCPECNKGYKGRIAILEVLIINDEIKDAITYKKPKNVLEKLVYTDNTKTLLQDGLEKVISGETTFEEIFKILDFTDDIFK